MISRCDNPVWGAGGTRANISSSDIGGAPTGPARAPSVAVAVAEGVATRVGVVETEETAVGVGLEVRVAVALAALGAVGVGALVALLVVTTLACAVGPTRVGSALGLAISVGGAIVLLEGVLLAVGVGLALGEGVASAVVVGPPTAWVGVLAEAASGCSAGSIANSRVKPRKRNRFATDVKWLRNRPSSQ